MIIYHTPRSQIIRGYSVTMRDDDGSNVLAMIFSKSDLDDLSVNEVSCLTAAPDRTSEKIPDANHNKAVTRPSKMNQLTYFSPNNSSAAEWCRFGHW